MNDMLAKAFVNSARVAMALYSAIVFMLFVKIRMEGEWILIRITVGGKQAWPELVGKKAQEAKRAVFKESPYVKIIDVVELGSHVTMDARCDRVRIWVQDDGIVALVPIVG